MIELQGIGLGYGERDVLADVWLELEAGELVVVAGRTGVGKSTLLGVLPGLVPRFTGGTLRGDLLVDGESVLERPPRERAHLVGYVGQDPAAGFVTDVVIDELAYGMEQLGVAPQTIRRRVEETLDLLGIAHLRERDLRTLSGGEQQRVAIGSVLAVHPRLLVLDEPTSALDPTAAEEVLATLARLVEDTDLTVLIAEHRLERVLPFADRLVLLDGGGRVRAGDPAALLADAPVAPPIVHLGRTLGWSPLPLTVREARRRVRAMPQPLPQPPPESPSQVSPATGAPGLRARGLSVLLGGRAVLREVDLSLSAGRVTALMGRNGAGKSTLLWTLQGAGRRATGSIDAGGLDPGDLDVAERAARVGMVPQRPGDLLYLASVRDECRAADEGAGVAAGTCRALLDRIAPGLRDETHPRDLSEGQRLALALAVVLTAVPPVLLLDEPTRGLDYPAKDALAAVLRELAAEGRTVLVATHDVEFVAAVADEVVVLAEGEVVSSGPRDAVLAESPAFAPQVAKILGPPWSSVAQVVRALRAGESP